MDWKNEMEVMVLSDLAAICKKLADNSDAPDWLRTRARQFAEDFDSLVPFRGEGTALEHAKGEQLLIKIARFLPTVLEVEARPSRRNPSDS